MFYNNDNDSAASMASSGTGTRIVYSNAYSWSS